MNKKNSSSSDKDRELNELIARYEEAKRENKQLYLDGDQLADIADRYASDRRFDEAQEIITYGLELHPGNTDLLVEQAYLYLDTMQVKKAKNVADCITETYETEVKILKAEIFLNEGKLDEAAGELDSIEDKETLDTIIDITYLYIDMGYPEKALPWLTQGLGVYDENEEFLAAIADCHRSGNQNEKAIYFYDKLIDKSPYNSTYWIGLAKCYFALENYEKTVECSDFALAADETYGEAYLMKAHSLFHLDNEEGAIESYQQALKSKVLPPEFIYMFMGLAYTNKDKWEQAYQNFDQAVKIIENEDSPIAGDIYSNAALSLSKLGKWEEAHELCRKALEKDPENVEIYLQEGQIYMEENDYEKARESWEQAIKYSPEPETLVQIGEYNLEYGIAINARLCFEAALGKDPDYPGIYEKLTATCIMLHDFEGFREYNEKTENPIKLEEYYKSFVAMSSEDSEFIQEFRKFMDMEKNMENEEKKEKKKKGK